MSEPSRSRGTFAAAIVAGAAVVSGVAVVMGVSGTIAWAQAPTLPSLPLPPKPGTLQPAKPVTPVPPKPVVSMAELLKASPASDWRLIDPANTVYFDLPAGRVIVDAHKRLPGRGAWLHARRECVEAVIKGSGFSKSFRKKTRPLEVEQLWQALNEEEGSRA